MARTKRQPLYVGDVTGGGGGGGGAGVWDPAGTAAAAVAAHELAYNHHDPVTLSAAADVLLSLSTQELGLDNQNANLIFAGPATGAAAAPTFRAMVEADLGTGLVPTFAGVKVYSAGQGVNLTPYVSASESSLHVTSSLANTMAGIRVYPPSGTGTGAGYGATYEFYASGYPGAASFQRLIHVATTGGMYIASDSATASGVPIYIRCGTGLWSGRGNAITISAANPSRVAIPNLDVATSYTLGGTLTGNITHGWASWQAETRYNAFWYWGIYFDEPTRKLTIQNQSNDSGGNIYLTPSVTPSVGYVYSASLRLPKTGTAYRLPVYSAANVMTELAAVGATGEVLVGNTGAIPSWSNSPTVTTIKCSGLTDGYLPYHVSDATGLADSPMRSTAADVGMGMAPTTNVRLSVQATAACEATLGTTLLTNGDFATNDLT
ncbi:MAG: hypothetical protein PHC52_11430, partial [Syntrophales bacterium]|nr:hypothetical protein [Syntrophales bacterium]